MLEPLIEERIIPQAEARNVTPEQLRQTDVGDYLYSMWGEWTSSSGASFSATYVPRHSESPYIVFRSDGAGKRKFASEQRRLRRKLGTQWLITSRASPGFRGDGLSTIIRLMFHRTPARVGAAFSEMAEDARISRAYFRGLPHSVYEASPLNLRVK